jgi:protein-S-isoprenylcysteine O-methyltransferase
VPPSFFQFLPYWLLGGLVAVEVYAGRVRRSDVARRFDPSFIPIIILIGGGYGTAFELVKDWRALGPPLGEWASWAGAVSFAAGAALRVWSVATLGRYFTYVVQVSPDQKVVDTGPYRLVRHPSYSGALLMGLGIGLALRSPYSALAIVASSFLAYLIRILVEERALAQGIGEPYRAYMARTKRLVPFVW